MSKEKAVSVDKLKEWVEFEIKKNFPESVDQYVDGRKTVLELLLRRLEQGYFNLRVEEGDNQ